MKIFHISDLHIGRDFNGYNLLEDQRCVLNNVKEQILKYEPKYLILAGDIFDKYNPSNDAMTLFDNFLMELSKINIRTIIISGNHDSKQKLNYLSRFLSKYNLYLFTDIKSTGITFDDDKISFFPIPYLHEYEIRKYDETDNLTEVEIYEKLIDNYFINVDPEYIHIAICHNLIIGGIKSQSERTLSIGGLEELPAYLFHKFDYTALGHLHINQKMGTNIYYSGSIMKYSTSEFNNINYIMIYDTMTNEVDKIEIQQPRGCRLIKDTIDNILINAKNDNNKNDYIAIELLDDGMVHDAHKRLSQFYPYIVSITQNKYKTNKNNNIRFNDSFNLDPYSVFIEFYTKMLNLEPNEESKNYIKDILTNIKEAE